MISLNSSKIVGDCAVKTAALAELRRADANAAAVAQFVDLIENIHDIETDLERSLLCDLNPAIQVYVKRLIGMVLFGVCKTPA